MYSRRLNVEAKQNRKKAIGFLLLSVSAVLIMLFYGFPFLAKISNLAYDLKETDDSIESTDKTPPPPPSLTNLPVATKESKIELTGRSEPGSNVYISVNGETYESLTNNEGKFSHSVSLTEEENIILIYAKDSTGNKSQDSEEYTVLFDQEEPEVEITKPKDGDSFYGSKARQVTIEGKTEKDVQLHINDHLVIVDSGGNFMTFVALNDGDNIIPVRAQDQAGNLTETSITLKYIP